MNGYSGSANDAFGLTDSILSEEMMSNWTNKKRRFKLGKKK